MLLWPEEMHTGHSVNCFMSNVVIPNLIVTYLTHHDNADDALSDILKTTYVSDYNIFINLYTL